MVFERQHWCSDSNRTILDYTIWTLIGFRLYNSICKPILPLMQQTNHNQKIFFLEVDPSGLFLLQICSNTNIYTVYQIYLQSTFFSSQKERNKETKKGRNTEKRRTKERRKKERMKYWKSYRLQQNTQSKDVLMKKGIYIEQCSMKAKNVV